MRLRTPAFLAVVVLATACLDPLPIPDGRFGAITAPAYQGLGASYVLRPEAAFYGQTDLDYEPVLTDTCVVAQYTVNTGSIANLRFLNAGDFLQTSVSGRVDSLLPVPNVAVRVYQSPLANGIPFTPGDTLTVVVPGATFPASAVSVRTAEEFTHAPIGVPAVDANLPLTWTPAIAGGSQMTFSLRYNNGFISTGLNEQVYCSFVDDGSATIPSGYLDGWRDALNNERATRATRVRASQVVIDTRTRLSLLSTFSQPVNTINAPTLR